MDRKKTETARDLPAGMWGKARREGQALRGQVTPRRKIARHVVAGAAVLAAWAGGAQATEGGGTAYFQGQKTTNLGLLPPDGFSYSELNFFYDANKLAGRYGQSFLPKYHVEVEQLGARLSYVFPEQFAGTKWGMTLQIPMLQSMFQKKSPDEVHFPVDRRQWGLGDVKFAPIQMGWSGDTAIGHIDHNVQVYLSAPTGQYDNTYPFNVSRNYWSYWVSFGQTWQPTKDIEIGFMPSYIKNMEDTHTHYQSGDEFEVDYNIGHRISGYTWFDINGYYYKQLTGDTQFGRPVIIPHDPGAGFMGRVLGIGPQVRFPLFGVGVIAKWQHEMLVENRPQGDRVWLIFSGRF